MHRYIMISAFIVTFAILFLILINNNTIPVMNYFPIDENAFFTEADTKLYVTSNNSEIEWTIESISSDPAYLRQDVSLLYENGKFKGVQSKWRQHVDHLQQNKRFQHMNNALFQAISFHHGEFHYPDDDINSIQKMTSNQLYFVRENEKKFVFQEPSNTYEKKWEKKLQSDTDSKLEIHWNNLINYYNIEEEKYDSFPLTDIVNYEHAALPNRTEQETKKIIGQLWEGLYKNYILLLAEKNEQATHYVPLIMISKKSDHLLVLFELDNKYQQLIQKIS